MEKSREKLEINQTVHREKQKTVKNKRDTIVELTRAALLTAVFCVLAPFTIYLPFGPVGVTLGSFLAYLTGFLLGVKWSCISVFLYLCIGFAGIPVFSGYTAGAGVLFGPTGGFLLGYIPCGALVGLFSEKSIAGKKGLPGFLLGMISGTVVLYLTGTLWFLFVYGGASSPGEAIAACVLPFLPADMVKIIFAVLLYRPFVRLKRCML